MLNGEIVQIDFQRRKSLTRQICNGYRAEIRMLTGLVV